MTTSELLNLSSVEISKLKKTQFEKQMEYYKYIFSTIEHIPLIPFSAQTGFGNDEIRKLIEESINNFNNTEV